MAASANRARLARRLTVEHGDPETAEAVAADLDDGVLDLVLAVAGGDIESSPALSSTPPTMADDEVDSLWLFSWGYRIDPAAGIAAVALTDTPPPCSSPAP